MHSVPIKPLFTALLAGSLLLKLTSCAPNNQDNAVKKERTNPSSPNATNTADSSQSAVKTDSATAAKEEKKEQVKYDAAKLTVFNLRIATQQLSLTKGLNLSYDPDGRADYIEYMVCPLAATGKTCNKEVLDCSAGGECFTGLTVYNRVRIAQLFPGQALFKVKACVEQDHAQGSETCGPWEEKTFDTGAYDPRVASLLSQAQSIKEDLGNLVAHDYRNALITFEKEAKACDKLDASVKRVLDSKVKVVEQFLLAPISWFYQSGLGLGDTILGDGGTGEVLAAVGKLGAAVSKELDVACQALGEGTHDKVCDVLKGLVTFGSSMILGLNPVPAFGTISNAIHDVYYGTFLGKGDILVPKGCHAEENLQRSAQAIQTQIQSKLQNLQALKQELQSKGESTVIPQAEPTE